MKLQSLLIFLSCVTYTLSAGTVSPCDNEITDCYLIDTVDFSYLSLVSTTYPDAQASGNITIADSQLYDYVLKWSVEANKEFSYNLKFFSSNTTYDIDCTQSKVWVNGTFYGMEEVTSGSDEYCTLTVDDLITREQLQDTSNIYFLFKNMVEPGSTLYIEENANDPVDPSNIVIHWLYAFDETTVSTNENDGNVYLNLTLSSIDHSDDPEFNDSACLSLPDLMSTLSLSGCTLNLDTNFGDTTFQYVMPRSQYETCSSGVSVVGENVVYTTTITLQGAGIENCYYVQEFERTQDISITVLRSAELTISENFDNMDIRISDYTVERCTPIENYIFPQARLRLTYEIDLFGDFGSFVNPGTFGVGYNMQILGGSCVTHPSHPNGTRCSYQFRTAGCALIYETTNGQCAFSDGQFTSLSNIAFQENAWFNNSITITHVVDALDTNVELRTFPSDQCGTGEENTLINVNDAYTYAGVARNFESDYSVDFDTVPDYLTFEKDVVLRMSVTDGSFTDTDLQITSVAVVLKDPETGSTLQRVSWSKDTKENLMGISSSIYAQNPHFCRHYTSATSTCADFYVVDGTRWNSYMAALNSHNEICRISGDTRNVDYFSFTPSSWFPNLNYPRVTVEYTIGSVIRDCSNRRVLRDARELSSNIEYIVDSSSFTLVTTTVVDESTNTTTTTNTFTDTSDDDEELKDALKRAGVGIGVISFLLILCCVTVFSCQVLEERRKARMYGYQAQPMRGNQARPQLGFGRRM